jgi:hypothetical protein
MENALLVSGKARAETLTTANASLGPSLMLVRLARGVTVSVYGRSV